MKNLEQIRARNANQAIKGGVRGRGGEGGDALSGFPALVVNNGLLATLAFSISKQNKDGYKEICTAIAQHLSDPEIHLLRDKPANCEGLRDFLAEQDSATLRLCTAEALAYLNYLRRFAKGVEKQQNHREG
jgi:CRISPR-associated protein Cmr5